MEVLAPLVRWWLFERHRRPAKAAPQAYPDLTADAIGAYARGLVNSAPSIYQPEHSAAVAPFPSVAEFLARYAAPPGTVAAIARLVPPEWGKPRLTPSNWGGKPPGWQRGVSLPRSTIKPPWDGHPEMVARVQGAVDELVKAIEGRKFEAWRVIEHYDVRQDDYFIRIDAWGPV